MTWPILKQAMDAVILAMFIKSLNGIQPSILAPTILQSRQIPLYSTCDIPEWPSLLWAVLMCINQLSWKSWHPGRLLLPQAANLQGLRWRVWVGHRHKYSHHYGMWPVLARSSTCLWQLKYSLVCAHTKWLKNWETLKALTPVFFKAWPAAFSSGFWK